MNIYIQHAGSGCFIGLMSTWVASIASARDFHSSESALNFCFGRQLSTVGLHSAYYENRRQVVWRVMDAKAIQPGVAAAEPPAALSGDIPVQRQLL